MDTVTEIPASEIIARGRAVGHDFYWFHVGLVREVERLHGLGETSYPAVAIAGNIKAHSGDVVRWGRMLTDAGILRETEPAWEYDGVWFGLA